MKLIDADVLINSLRGNVLIDVTTELENEIARQEEIGNETMKAYACL